MKGKIGRGNEERRRKADDASWLFIFKRILLLIFQVQSIGDFEKIGIAKRFFLTKWRNGISYS